MMTYEEFGKLPADRSVIPSSCASFSESAYYVAEASQRYFNEFFENVGITELAIFEATGTVVVYEGEKLDAFKKGVADIFAKIWQAIKGAYERIMKAFDELKRKTNAKYLKVSGADINNIPKEKYDATLGKFKYQKYKIDGIDNKCKEFKVDIPNFDGKSAEEAKTLADEYLSTVYSKVCDIKDAKDIESLQNGIKEACKDGEPEVIAQSALADTIAIRAGRIDAELRDIGNDYRTTKAELHKAQSNVNKLKDKDMDAAKYALSCTTKAILAKHSACMAVIDVRKARLKQDLTVARMATALKEANERAAKKEKKAEPKNESANFVDKAFEW